MTERKIIEVPLSYLGCAELNGSVDDAIEKLLYIQRNYGGAAILEYGRYVHRGDTNSYKVFTSRPETDGEFAERVRKADLLKTSTIEQERKKLKTLAAKFNMTLVPKSRTG